jgi:hypothetical protein
VALTDQQKYYAKVITALHENWHPHEGQTAIGRALFNDNIQYVFAECGRNFGKTDLIVYCHARFAMLNPDTENYYFSPLSKQSREIAWEPRRYLKLIPEEWIESVNNQEMRINLKTGSFIKLDGSDNTEAYRGVKPKGLVVLDEFKDFKHEFWEAFEPNTIFCKVVIIGTPPPIENDNHLFFKVADEFKNNEKKRYFNFPSTTNPHIPYEWFMDKKADLYRRGEGYVWEREYEAKRVRGGVNKIFPMLKPEIVKEHSEVLKMIERDRKRLMWFVWADPAASSCFAVLFVAINPFTKDIYWLDEIYETNQQRMSVRVIGSELIAKRNELWQDEWRQGYDEAATWWRSEMFDSFNEYFEPTQKASNKKENGISLIKDIILGGKLTMSDRCVKGYWEMDNYVMDRTGEIPKKNDHQIDNFRYILAAAGYEFSQVIEKKEEDNENFRGARMSHDFKEKEKGYAEWEP